MAALWLVPAVGAAAVFAQLTAHETRVGTVPVSADRHPGAEVLAGTAPAAGDGVDPIPSPLVLAGDWASYGECEPVDGEPFRACGRSPDDPTPARRVLVTGDSHAGQLGLLVAGHAEEQGFAVETGRRGSCPLTTDPDHLADSPEDYRRCLRLNERRLAAIAARPPDLVVTVGSRSAAGSAEEEVPPGYVAAWREIADLGVPVLVLRDNPRWSANPVECVLREGAGSCTRARDDAYRVDPLAYVAKVLPGVTYLDTSRYLCDEDRCPPVVGGVHVYMDDNHVSGTYARTMAEAAGPELRRELRSLVPWWR